MSHLDLNQSALKGYQFQAALYDLYTTWVAKWNEAQEAVDDGFDATAKWAIVDSLAVLINNGLAFLSPIATNTRSKDFMERTMALAFTNGHLATSLRKAWDPGNIVVSHPEMMFVATSAMALSQSGFSPVLALGQVLKTAYGIDFRKITPGNVHDMWASETGGGALPGLATLLETSVDYSDDFYRWGESTGDLKNAAAMTSLGAQLQEVAMIWVQVVDSALNGKPLPLKVPMNLKVALAAGIFLQPIRPRAPAAVTRNPFKTETTPPIVNKLPPNTTKVFGKDSATGSDSGGGNNGGNNRPPAPGTEVDPVIPDEPWDGGNDFIPDTNVVIPADVRPKSMVPLIVIGGAVVLGAVIAWRS
jgi:hypothetical protein